MPASDVTLERKKRLGQYFTGYKLAHLLAVIADCPEAITVLDPMCGSGDMLLASADVYQESQLFGIEIDSSALELCRKKFGSRSKKPLCVEGNAFVWSTVSKLPVQQFDLVITNPPYVRYQSLAQSESGYDGLPDAEAVRRGLLEIAHHLNSLSDEDRKIFISLIEGYSGLSDLAVPSWILCAMLTAPGGTLAMVVPESWLSRDYARPVQYLLLKLFRIMWVIEDANCVWFDEALVKTNLLVARRLNVAEKWYPSREEKIYPQVMLPETSINEKSIVGNCFVNHPSPDHAFKEELNRLSEKTGNESLAQYAVTYQSLERKRRELISKSMRFRWFRNCEPELIRRTSLSEEAVNQVLLPQELSDMIPPDHVRFVTVEQIGVMVGQGLRTGANDFFYCDLLEESGEYSLVAPGKVYGIDRLLVPAGAILPVLRKQSELTEGYQIIDSKLKGRLLYLEHFIHPRELASSAFNPETYKLMNHQLAEFVTIAEQTNIGSADKPKWTPQLSAVRTNASKRSGRFWYMIPPLAPRHIPDLFVPRVNYLHPKVMLNSQNKVIIDANFSTIWLTEAATVDKYSLLAILNSSWAVAAMELIATVMGGGALKLEATHLRRLPIPVLNKEQWSEISSFGKELVNSDKSNDVLVKIDHYVAKILFDEHAGEKLQKLKEIKEQKLLNRKGK